MIWDRHHCNLLVKLFNEKWKRFGYDDEAWSEYLIENRICAMGLDLVVSSWNAANEIYVCIENPTCEEIFERPDRISENYSRSIFCKESIWYLVPKYFAEEALKMRSLP
jgi:hypothetical protein